MTLGDDLLDGIAEIAAYLKFSEKRTWNLHANGLIPTQKVGHSVIARKSVLDRHFNGGAPAQYTQNSGS